MRVRAWHLLMGVVLVTAPALASYDSPKPQLPQPTSSAGSMSPDAAKGDPGSIRVKAEPYYKDAYNDVAKGSRMVADGKGKNALKQFKRALDHGQAAVAIDSTYYEAWNLVGFASRKLGDYPNSFAAYRVALRLNPDFGLAREYYGEGLLETGDVDGAMAQLVELKRIGDQPLVDELQKAIDRHAVAGGTNGATKTAAATSAPQAATPDSTGTAGK